MKLRILFIVFAVCFIAYPVLHALISGYDYPELFRDIVICTVGTAFSLTIVHLLRRIEKLEQNNSNQE